MAIKGNGIIGIRREDKNRWERRVPLTPVQVRELVQSGVQVIVQPSNIRCYSDGEYEEAGATVSEDLSPAATILAVKEVPAALLIPERTYIFFSHTIKAQPHNMPLLDTMLEKRIRMIDYEKITNPKNERLVRFGPYAGYAGTIDILAAVGDRLLALGFSTPFLYCSLSRTYRSLDDAKDAIRNVGKVIERIGLPDALCPFIIGVTSTGSVATAALEILELLPHKFVSSDDLESVMKTKDRRCVYITVSESKHMVKPKDRSKPFDKKEYYANPASYEPIYHEKVLPYLSLMVNCMYWEPKYPRLVTTRQAQQLMREKRWRLHAIADISCDPQGSVEFFVHATTIDNPTFVYDVMNQRTNYDIHSDGVLFLGVDHLPAELPFQSSEFFGNSLLPFVKPIALSDGSASFENQANDLPAEVHKAIITSHGQLTPPFQYIAELRKNTMKAVRRILVLGSGFVSAGLVHYFAELSRNQLTIASNILEQAQKLVDEFAPTTARAVLLDLEDSVVLQSLVSKHDIVISLLPATLHVRVAEVCIREKKSLITTSYISPELASLDSAARDAGIVILNEVGLDPGIDHCSAKMVIDQIHSKGGKVISFTSFAGGLPAPENSNNPLGYKFSWNPRGVLTAAEAPARFLVNGQVVERASGQTYEHACPQRVYRGFNLVGVANRDSIKYKELYGIPEAETMLRGTLRFPGFATMVLAFRGLGLMDTNSLDENRPQSWPDLLSAVLRVSVDSVRTAVQQKLEHVFRGDMERVSEALAGLKWFGMFLDTTKYDGAAKTPIDALTSLLNATLVYEKGERDLVILTHEFIYQLPGQPRKQKKMASLVMYGDPLGQPGALTAMARCVGVPCAIATQLVLDNVISRVGVCGPMTADLYVPLLEALEEKGIRLIESVEEIYE
eukprot:ANDGO_06073.mRNA.1 Alpha-aminoadipic semialdehyde synthase